MLRKYLFKTIFRFKHKPYTQTPILSPYSRSSFQDHSAYRHHRARQHSEILGQTASRAVPDDSGHRSL